MKLSITKRLETLLKKVKEQDKALKVLEKKVEELELIEDIEYKCKEENDVV